MRISTISSEQLAVIIQACLNGSRPVDYHPRLPVTPNALALDGAACVERGASELHIHPRGADGRESLRAVDDTMRRLRIACPGVPVGVSTGDWIEGDEERTRACIAAWETLPDYASVNISEPDHVAVMDILSRRNIGIEAGLASVADAQRLVALPNCGTVLRILIEIEEQDIGAAHNVADGILGVLERSGLDKPVLLHGFDATVWSFVRRAKLNDWSTRVGLEDDNRRSDGRPANDNAELVSDAVAIFAGDTI